MASELNPVAAWIYERLAHDPDGVDGRGRAYRGLDSLVAGRIYEMRVPQDGGFPCVVFAFHSGRDRRGTGGARVCTRLLYQVKGIDVGEDFTAVGRIADRIDALLQQAQDRDDPTVIGVSRTDPVQYMDEADGVEHVHQGGMYSVFAYTQD